MVKPGRSEDADLDAEQQARMAEAVRVKFADDTPKRHFKPSRSDEASADASLLAAFEGPIPENVKLQQLLGTPSASVCIEQTTGDVPLEYVETDYYKGFHGADRALHHTTGTGFIQVQNNGTIDISSLPDAPLLSAEVTTIGANFEVPEEFMATEYYDDLNAVHVKELHHTTGSGFIQVEKNNQSTAFNGSSSGLLRTRSGGNPATNEWIPTESTTVIYTSKKPGRSDD